MMGKHRLLLCSSRQNYVKGTCKQGKEILVLYNPGNFFDKYGNNYLLKIIYSPWADLLVIWLFSYKISLSL
jgi:hypothetical protein